MQTVIILIFDGVELLDFAGPYEVFSACGKGEDEYLYQVRTASPDGQPIRAANGLVVVPDMAFADVGQPDVLIVPGGNGVYPLKDDPALHRLIQAQVAAERQTLSVCTGALLLAKAGVLAGKPATTYHTRFERLVEYDPTITPRVGERWVDNGTVITSAGVSAGIDASLYLIARQHGRAIADATAQYIEYEHWARLSLELS
jgi:transcriptional regulator GlxA family with amidase domain